jgi:hypothetical protein
MKQKEEKTGRFIMLFVCIIIIWGVFGIFPFFIFDKWADRGTFGDMFGAINSLFSALAFGGVIYTIYLQKTELGLQRLELIETRKELSRSAEAQEKSEKALNKQLTSMTLTAKLNALNSLVTIFSDRAEEVKTKSSIDYGNYIAKRDMFIHEIETTLKEIERFK